MVARMAEPGDVRETVVFTNLDTGESRTVTNVAQRRGAVVLEGDGRFEDLRFICSLADSTSGDKGCTGKPVMCAVEYQGDRAEGYMSGLRVVAAGAIVDVRVRIAVPPKGRTK